MNWPHLERRPLSVRGVTHEGPKAMCDWSWVPATRSAVWPQFWPQNGLKTILQPPGKQGQDWSHKKSRQGRVIYVSICLCTLTGTWAVAIVNVFLWQFISLTLLLVLFLLSLCKLRKDSEILSLGNMHSMSKARDRDSSTILGHILAAQFEMSRLFLDDPAISLETLRWWVRSCHSPIPCSWFRIVLSWYQLKCPWPRCHYLSRTSDESNRGGKCLCPSKLK